MQHVSVLTNEIIHWSHLDPKSIVVDGTLGSGGHARECAKILGKFGKLVVIDRDTSSIARVQEKGITTRGEVHYVHGNFTNIPTILEDLSIQSADAIILDLGWSMDQFIDPARGFSFMVDGPLDMRLDLPSKNQTAADVINTYSEKELADIFFNLADEQRSRPIAHAIVKARKVKKITTTFELVDIVKSVSSRSSKINPATKVFQALRIEVNHELSDLLNGISDIVNSLKSGGRLLIITFHSIEDRIVKQEFVRLQKEGVATILTKKPIIPTTTELRKNPRSRSAKLRVITKQ